MQPERDAEPERAETIREGRLEPVALDEAQGPARAPGRPAARLTGPAARARPAPASADVRLLAIATEHLARLGPKRVTVVAVAAEAGMTHANVYRYFPSKDALLDAVAGRWLREVETRLAGIADGPDPADDKIERLLSALSAVQRDALVDEPNLFAVHLDATVEARPIARRHRVRLRSLVERIVEEGMATGAFSARDRERAIAYIFDASYRFTHPLAIQHDSDVPRDLVEARLGAVIHAIQRVLRAGIL
ncbi:TetR family transcriptional regulator [Methylobacterium oxalidis]|uniref:TetR family transcriptional regulator n=1 Tax=Methylobacterium oxalidis TaxID=944322 RepID=A0A512JC04_9HYPH|nr:TetR family transcriptional regulator [Methylobacterium oxalidis]GJE35089.1 Nucleoid occlusion factor SlmA [Methylobacterium oxalidis]GLS65209.1 TetR family transcriptional regulator [Methylobacterium oxalidis]